MDKRKSSKNGDALQLHIDRKKEMMEYDRQDNKHEKWKTPDACSEEIHEELRT